MVDGQYEASVKTKFGKQKARVTLESAGNELTATVEALGKRKVVKGACTDDAFMFTGRVKVPFLGEVDCDLTGFMEGDTFTALVKTNKGDFEIRGVRI